MLSLSRSSEPEEYIPLQSCETESDGSDISPKPPKQLRVNPLLVVVCVLCTVTNALLLFLAPATRSTLAEWPIKRDAMRHLRRPSQFIGLDRVARPSPPTPLQFYNFPIVVAPVDSAHGNRVFDDDPRRYLGHSGGVSSEWRRILVTDTISTIVQFRAIDYGMETCELHVDLPSQQTNSTSYPGHSISISLYRIDASFPVDTKTLSYDTRPARLFKIDDITMVVGNVYHWHHKFLCASEEVLSFELIRASFDSDYDCHVEWWQDRDGTGDGPGIYIMQYSTV